MSTPQNPTDTLKTHFGHASFRPGQEAVVKRLLDGGSALAVFPTGAGKSLCYQLPALSFEGITIVISPLIALMKDQVDGLRARGIAAARLDSSLERDEVRAIHRQLDEGRLRLLYIAPERLGNERFLARLRRLRIDLLAVDEAHCISEWGHNFRPDYLKIARLSRELGVPRVLALTATATPQVANDVLDAFDIPKEGHVQTGFRRPNLSLRVLPCEDDARPARLLELLRADAGPSIVYVTYQRSAETVSDYLSAQGIPAAAYHAGMRDERRSEVQDSFMQDTVRVVVATIAFGMGIDKPDIRAIYHYNLPKTLENYAQEIGRAGRDGLPARCTLLGCADDRVGLENFAYGDTPTDDSLRGLLEELAAQDDTFDVAVSDLSARFDLRPLVVTTALTYLELDGLLAGTGPFYGGYKLHLLLPEEEVLARFDPARQDFLRKVFAAGKAGRKWLHLEPVAAAVAIDEPRERIVSAITWLGEQGLAEVQTSAWRQGYRWLDRSQAPRGLDTLRERFASREQNDVARIARVLAFAEHGECLTRHLLDYFGEPMAEDCGQCTSCESPGERQLPAKPRPTPEEAESTLVRELFEEGHPALSHPRQLARFLCGLQSPMATRARLHRDPRMGALARHPFGEILRLTTSLQEGV